MSSGAGAEAVRGPLVVGVDVGGTKVMAGVVSAAGVVTSIVTLPTPGRTASVAHVEDLVTAAVHEAAAGRPLAAVGVSAAGFVDGEGDRVAFAPHLPWRDDPVRPRLVQRWGVPVALENDATCALVAEATHGAAQGCDSAVLVTVGTGIGGGLLVHGRVVRGSGGMAGEYGHMTLVPGGRACECGGHGCWEQYCSGRALTRAAVRAYSHDSPVLSELCGGDPSRLTGRMVTHAARQGDGAALQAFAEVGQWLGAGLSNLVAAIDPEVVVVGGGVSTAGDLLCDPARLELAARLVGAAHRRVPDVVAAATGPAAGVIGASELARRLLA